MHRLRKYFSKSLIGLIIVITGLYTAGCTGPRQITAPDAKELSTVKPGESEKGGVII